MTLPTSFTQRGFIGYSRFPYTWNELGFLVFR